MWRGCILLLLFFMNQECSIYRLKWWCYTRLWPLMKRILSTTFFVVSCNFSATVTVQNCFLFLIHKTSSLLHRFRKRCYFEFKCNSPPTVTYFHKHPIATVHQLLLVFEFKRQVAYCNSLSNVTLFFLQQRFYQMLHCFAFYNTS
jgi:hypothetical protein